MLPYDTPHTTRQKQQTAEHIPRTSVQYLCTVQVTQERHSMLGIRNPSLSIVLAVTILGCSCIFLSDSFTIPVHCRNKRINGGSSSGSIGSLSFQSDSNSGDIAKSKSTHQRMKRVCVRVESDLDECLRGFSTPQHLVDKIEQVKKIQNQYGNANLYKREWVDAKGSKKNPEKISTAGADITSTTKAVQSFTVLQFNTLAEGLSSGPTVCAPFERQEQEQENEIFNSKNDESKNDEKRKCIFGGFNIPNPEISLDFKLRRWRIIEVLLGGGSSDSFDLIAMEEVDRFYGFFEPVLKILGYNGLFLPKPCSPGIKFGWYSDGCALFWKKDTFELIHEIREEFEVGTQVYIIATLRHKMTGRLVMVAVTHLKAQNHSAQERIRTCQANQLIKCVHEAANRDSSEFSMRSTDIPIVLMGDFNSDPNGEDKSCVRNILSSEYIDLSSAYDLENNDIFTTWKTRGDTTFRRTIDYIFHNSNESKGFRCTHVLSIPEGDKMEATKLPGLQYPSDHISIGARFEIEKIV